MGFKRPEVRIFSPRQPGSFVDQGFRDFFMPVEKPRKSPLTYRRDCPRGTGTTIGSIGSIGWTIHLLMNASGENISEKSAGLCYDWIREASRGFFKSF